MRPFDRIENFEQQATQDKEIDKKMHEELRNLRDGDKTSENSFSLGDEQKAAYQQEVKRQAALMNNWQGDIGEGAATRVASEKLGLTPDPRFDQPYHGMDGVYRGKGGQLVVVEAKLAEKGIGALGKGKIEDPRTHQMQPEWVNYKAELMQDDSTKQYSLGNKEIGKEIQRVGVENVRRLVVAIDPQTLEVKVYEGQADRTWKEIGRWDGIDLEQPHWGAK